MTSTTKRIVFPIVIILIAAAIVAALVAGKKKPERKNDTNNAPFVSVKTVELAPLTLSVKSQGLVQAKFQTQLLAQVSGEITQVSEKFVRGGLVNKGELLAQVDPFNYQVKLQQANASLASAKAQFILERAQGRVAEAEWEKITNAEPSELGLRKPQQEQALAGVKAAEAGVRQATKDLQRTRIIAPFDALVAARNVSPGTFANMGTHIGTVLDVETAEIRLPVSNNDLAFLEAGGINAPVNLVATLSNRIVSWQANIVRDEGVVDDKSRMVYLVAQLEDPYNRSGQSDAPRLPFGTYVTAEIEGRHIASAAYVPRQLLRDNRLALYGNNNTLTFAEVEVIRHEGKFSVISNGLMDGDLLITSSLEYPVEGMALSTEAAEEDDSMSGAQPLITAEPQATTLTDKES
ncbi:efflux RND transporter periplasmic adaptor subunit [Teredinibacter haidensis]|uniref:efflux RND transporter periplasmic adaptor subunit n=1 Tax=Teredinibacter haidensis TaxID=2731755 RepID=UPI000948F352|nr:efflux RND transporter periplasmic adaptor subunit [Teredinibacter haidensis]